MFLYDVGESSAYSSAQHMLGESSFLQSFLEDFGGIGIVWEHRFVFLCTLASKAKTTRLTPIAGYRYYGQSLPMGTINANTPAEHFQYLTHAQALADIPYFARNFSRSDIPDEDLSPKGTPWIMIGGSYSGMRAAFTRNEYPDTIYAAWASSAPVQARVDMSIYFEQVYRGMVGNGYEGCAHDLHAAMRYIDSQLALNGSASDDIKQLFLGEGAEVNSDGDFTASLSYIYGTFQSYGMGGGDTGLGSLCDWMEELPTSTRSALASTGTSTATITKRNEEKTISRIIGRHRAAASMPEDSNAQPTNSEASQTATPTPSTGWAPYIGDRAVAERFASWPQLIPLINAYADTDCDSEVVSDDSSCVLGGRLTDPATISWTWQYCSQWGFFQSDNISPDPTHSLLSSSQSLAYNQEVCNRQFPDALDKGLLPASPATEATNAETGGWTIRPSNTYWSGGEFDPWRTLSPLSTESFAPDFVTFRSDIPQCNRATAERELFGYVMQNAMHCFDFDMGFDEGDNSRNLFKRALNEWLSCWKAKARRTWVG